MFASIYDSAAEESQAFSDLISAYPEGLLDAFNISTNYLNSVETFISGQFLSLFALVGSVYAVYLGIGEIGGKINDKTISVYMSKNISRTSLYLTTAATNSIIIFCSNCFIWLVLYAQMHFFTSQDSISVQYFWSAALITSLIMITWTIIGQFLGIILDSPAARGLGAAYIVFGYFINNLSALTNFPEWVNPITLFYFLDAELLRDEFEVGSNNIVVLISISILFLLLGVIRFRKKNISI